MQSNRRGRSSATASAPAGRESARAVGLRYSRDDQPGIRRRRAGRGFSYVGPGGRAIRDAVAVERIKSLAIPPAWTDVWICPDPDGHLQATGRDARGRKQYRYHPRFRRRREASKFGQLIEFGGRLPRIRRRADRDLARPGLPREKVLAAVVRLLELTLVRVGNEEYARLNRSFGLTTLQDRHARIRGGSIRFRFRGKGGRIHEVGLRDRRLARVVGRCQDLPGQDLFQYLDEDGEVRSIDSDAVNAYLRDIAGADVSAKMFRTWAATVLACRALVGSSDDNAAGPAIDRASKANAKAIARVGKRAVVAAMRDVSDVLGNTPTVCRASYVHPAVVEAYLEGVPGLPMERGMAGLDEPFSRSEELAVLDLLRTRVGRRQRTVGARRRTRKRREPAHVGPARGAERG